MLVGVSFVVVPLWSRTDSRAAQEPIALKAALNTIQTFQACDFHHFHHAFSFNTAASPQTVVGGRGGFYILSLSFRTFSFETFE
jgi:hypothetical protein